MRYIKIFLKEFKSFLQFCLDYDDDDLSPLNNATVREELYISCAVERRQTYVFKTYSGILEGLIINLILFVCMLILFGLIRRRVFDHGRLAYVERKKDEQKDREINAIREELWYQIFYSDYLNGIQSNNNNLTDDQREEMASKFLSSYRRSEAFEIDDDVNLFQWIIAPFRISKEHLLRKCGPDAVYYLNFQQNLLILSGIMLVISLFMILPINTTGNLEGTIVSFGFTTISNLTPKSIFLWIHCIIAVVYIPLTELIMRRSMGRKAFRGLPTKVVMITNIHKHECDKSTIAETLNNAFEDDLSIDHIELAYNISKLCNVSKKLERATMAREYCEKNYEEVKDWKIRPRLFSFKRMPAIEYYRQQEIKFKAEVELEREKAKEKTIGTAFVTFKNVDDADKIVNHKSAKLNKSWRYKYAPAPYDIIWENLNISSDKWIFKWIVVNAILFILLFFLTTPTIIVAQFAQLLNYDPKNIYSINKINSESTFVSDFLPVILLVIITALMPTIVVFSERILKHWFHSMENYALLCKSFVLFLFMILILPSLGLTSAQALIEWMTSNYPTRWECVFLPDKGAFFVNYIITAAFLNNGLELLRLPELFLYLWSIMTAKSKAEIPYIRKNSVYNFQFGNSYAWLLIIHTMSSVYSLICPLIMPFAFTYFILKHHIDRYNLYFQYRTAPMISSVGGKIHSVPVMIVRFSVLCILLLLVIFITIRGKFDMKKILLVILSTIMIAGLLIIIAKEKVKKMRKKLTRPVSTTVTLLPPLYTPDVLLTDKEKKAYRKRTIRMQRKYQQQRRQRGGESGLTERTERAEEQESQDLEDFDEQEEVQIQMPEPDQQEEMQVPEQQVIQLPEEDVVIEMPE